ncbi:MAG: NAD-dependent protein deacylase [Gammaproteobacteria bacterium]|nr:NAD-dependent protein deacylase [Gammaproteobacteria bacterium]
MPRFQSIVVLTGAGVSAESGIRTFRGSDGLWNGYAVRDVASPQAFERDPGLVHRFYNERRRQLQDTAIRPNAAHVALASLERKFAGEYLLITQNIDDLHERAGSRHVVHMHGEILKARCTASGKVSVVESDLSDSSACSCCPDEHPLRPHVVWFGEKPLYMDTIYRALANCDLFVAIGTSGQVYLAAGFAELAAAKGAHTVELNLQPSAVASHFAEKRYGTATELVGDFVARMLGTGTE